MLRASGMYGRRAAVLSSPAAIRGAPLRVPRCLLSSSTVRTSLAASVPPPAGVTIVETREEARRVCDILNKLPRSVYHAWDTEVVGLDASAQSPVGNGVVICASLYSGPDVDFGNGPRVWINNLDEAEGVLNEFKGVLEDATSRKVFHNYSFDFHELCNHGIETRGLAADTMHMARLWNTGRITSGGYGLEALSAELVDVKKVSMKELFAQPKLKKDGTKGKEKVLPELSSIQRNPETRNAWIDYSTTDAHATWLLRERLEQLLRQKPWVGSLTMFDLYNTYLCPFAQCLADMERAGIMVDVKNRLPAAEAAAVQDRKDAERIFLEWATTYCPDAARMNVGSDIQKAHFLFAPCKRVKPNMRSRKKVSEKEVGGFGEDVHKKYRKSPSMIDVDEPANAKSRDAAAHPYLASGVHGERLPAGAAAAHLEHAEGDTSSTSDSDETGRWNWGTSDSEDTDRLRAVAVDSEDIDVEPRVAALFEEEEDVEEEGERAYFVDSEDEALHMDPVLAARLRKQRMAVGAGAVAGAGAGSVTGRPAVGGGGGGGGGSAISPMLTTPLAKGKGASSAAASAAAVTAASAASELDGVGSMDADAGAVSKLGRDATVWPASRVFQVDNTEGYIEPGKKVAKVKRDIVLTGLGVPPVARTETGWPAVNSKVLKLMAGKVDGAKPAYGTVYEYFGGGESGKAACEAMHALYTVSTVDTMLSNFIVPLQTQADAQSRVHCSLNLNTETGRLSARRPNLQNQPALEKDRYGVRKAFQAAPGCKLIVADYGQLELRLLAHMAKCKSMIDAFAAGGDFHSRTAMGMYPNVAQAVKEGRVLLEWNDADGEPPAPLLKNVFSSERRKAKILNFSIAYGKTAMGLARDWNVSLDEARDTVEAWYSDRPEVRAWQQQVLVSARRDRATRTLLGRYRDLPDIVSSNFKARGHAERAAINTPIQGGAADVAMLAMLKVWRNAELQRLGWRMLLQVHDELIIEGPAHTANEAMALLVKDMANPFNSPLLVDLVVDANIADNWYDAK